MITQAAGTAVYLVHLMSFRIKAKDEAEARRKAILKLKKGLTAEQIEEIEEDEEQF